MWSAGMTNLVVTDFAADGLIMLFGPRASWRSGSVGGAGGSVYARGGSHEGQSEPTYVAFQRLITTPAFASG